MKDDYPFFEGKEVYTEYTEKINNIFKENNFNWKASPATFTNQIFVRPDDYFEWSKFPNVSRMGVHVYEGVARLGINGLPSMIESNSRKNLEKKGYVYQEPHDFRNLCWLIKPLENLESVVDELKDIEPILLQK